jgi:hypothetical protein
MDHDKLVDRLKRIQWTINQLDGSHKKGIRPVQDLKKQFYLQLETYNKEKEKYEKKWNEQFVPLHKFPQETIKAEYVISKF